MTTFLTIYIVVQFVALIYWLCEMITTKPYFEHNKNRFLSNWAEGGYFLLLICVVGPLFISAVAAFGCFYLNIEL